MKLSAKAKEQLNKVVERFKAGDLSPVTKILTINLPSDAPARQWTFSNRVMAYAQTGGLDCRGFRQWEQAGRKVKKGSRAGFILFPRMVKKTNDKGEEKRQCVGFGTTAVFSVDQTEGETITDYEPAQLPPLIDVAQRLGIDVQYMPLVDAFGYCTTDNSKLRLASHDESVFFHELAHAAHNTFETKVSGGQDPHRETVAELTACILMQTYGIKDTTGNAWKYIEHYNTDPVRAIMKALGEVEKVLDVIFNDPIA